MLKSIMRQLGIISLPWWIVIAIAAGLLFCLRHKNKRQLLGNVLIVYLMMVFASTVFSRLKVHQTDLVNFRLLKTWIDRFSGNASNRAELLLNFFMLFPVGVLIPLSSGKRFFQTVSIGFLITLVIEVLQLVTVRGWFELSDIVDNTVGVAIGYGCYFLGAALWKRIAPSRSQ